MPIISSEISLKISNLLKTMGKISDDSILEAKKKYEGNGKVPLGILHYLLEDKKITEDDVVAFDGVIDLVVDSIDDLLR